MLVDWSFSCWCPKFTSAWDGASECWKLNKGSVECVCVSKVDVKYVFCWRYYLGVGLNRLVVHMSVLYKVDLSITSIILIYSSPEDILSLLWVGGGGEGGRDGHRNRDALMREKNINGLSSIRTQTKDQTRTLGMCPHQELKSATFQCMGGCSKQLSHSARAEYKLLICSVCN